jgi:hypothetical protein
MRCHGTRKDYVKTGLQGMVLVCGMDSVVTKLGPVTPGGRWGLVNTVMYIHVTKNEKNILNSSVTVNFPWTLPRDIGCLFG